MNLTADQRAELESVAAGSEVTSLKRERQPKTLLPSLPPAAGTPHEHLANWLTVVLSQGGDPVTKAIRYGRHEDARLVIELRSGQRITFDRTADLFDSHALVRRVIIATGAQLPPYPYTDAVKIATTVLRMAELVAVDDDRGEAREWADTFLANAERNTHTVAEFATPAGRYEALSTLCQWKAPEDIPPPGISSRAERSVILLDASTGTRYVRTSDFAEHVRELGCRLKWGALHSRMIEIGWKHLGQVEQRQPRGAARLKTHLYAVSADWDQS